MFMPRAPEAFGMEIDSWTGDSFHHKKNKEERKRRKADR
jgi:hypothetical protein